MKKIKFTIGADPELMLVSNATGRLVSAISVLKNSKTKPKDLGGGVKLYADNVLAEIAMPPSAPEEAADNIFKAINLAAVAVSPEHQFKYRAAEAYPALALRNKAAWEVGCNPSFDAYSRTPNRIDKFPNEVRTGSFHIHIGREDWQDPSDDRMMTLDSQCEIVRMLDILVGLPAVILDVDRSAAARRSLYGKAGEFRPTPYGLEYRVLGNIHLSDKKRLDTIMMLVMNALNVIQENSAGTILRSIGADDVRLLINSSRRGSVLSILHYIPLPKNLMSHVKNWF